MARSMLRVLLVLFVLGAPWPVTGAAGISYASGEGLLTYLTCDAGCTSPADWSQLGLLRRGSGTMGFVLRLDSRDQPRIAFYQGTEEADWGPVLFYLWCQAQCATADTWDGTYLGLGTRQGQDPDLAFDGQDRPRLVYRRDQPQGLGYSACVSDCESMQAVWQHRTVEASDALDAAWPIPPLDGCTTSFWFGAYRPSLALDAAGNPRIAYDAEHAHGGASCQARVDFKAVRVVMIQQ